MNRRYWYENWKNNKDFSMENNRLKEKAFVYSSFPKANLFGFQTGDIRKIIASDIYARYLRFHDKNVLFPTGIHSLCNSSFVENKKHSSILNDDISNIISSQMLELGIGIDDEKFIDMRHNEFLSNLQLAFIDLYESGYISYKPIMVSYDSKNSKIYDDLDLHKNLPVIEHKCFVLNTEKVLNNVLDDINFLSCDSKVKEKLKSFFKPYKIMNIDFLVSNGSKLSLELKNPELIGGISYIIINPEYMDLSLYSSSEYFEEIINYLEDKENDLPYAFSGLYARNPLTGNDIPIFISVMYNKPVYLGIPSYNDEDLAFAKENDLPVIDIFDEKNKLINSDFLDHLELSDASELIFDSFVEAEIATVKYDYQHKEINLSSIDNFGPLFPFLEDKDIGVILSLKKYLPFAFSAKMRPELSDNVDIAGTIMNGTINNLFTEGMLSIISMVYDDIGSVVSIFSKEFEEDYTPINVCYTDNESLVANVLMPIIITNIIEDNCNIKLDKIISKVVLVNHTLDSFLSDIKRSNNNLIDFDKVLSSYYSDSIRLFAMITPLSDDFSFDEIVLNEINETIKQFEENITNCSDDDNQMLGYQIFVLHKEVEEAYNACDISKIANIGYDFIKKYGVSVKMSKKQIREVLITLAPVMPFLADNVYKEVLDGRFSIINEDWSID